MSDLISREKAYVVLTEYYHHKHFSQHVALREALGRVPSEDIDLSGFCDKLWESAYQKGYEAGQEERGCKGCKYIDLPAYNYPCNECSRFCLDYYHKTKGDSE